MARLLKVFHYCKAIESAMCKPWSAPCANAKAFEGLRFLQNHGLSSVQIAKLFILSPDGCWVPRKHIAALWFQGLAKKEKVRNSFFFFCKTTNLKRPMHFRGISRTPRQSIKSLWNLHRARSMVLHKIANHEMSCHLHRPGNLPCLQKETRAESQRS